MRYIPHTPEDREQMLGSIGVSSIEELFHSIPEQFRLTKLLNLPEPLAECQLRMRMQELAGANRDTSRVASFAGAGIYNHYVPAAVDQLISRSEFYTAYTPYQPEVSQGTLQAIFEFQTLVARYLQMEVSNASLYDGSTALNEAIAMSLRAFRNKRPKIVLAGAHHPEYLEVARTSQMNADKFMLQVGCDASGRTDLKALADAMGPTVAAIIVQYPNFFGVLEDLKAIRELATQHGALMVVTFTEALAFGMVAPPGAFGADIVVGEGQSLGLPMSSGGPLLGLMTAKKSLVRSMPGRLIGQTEDRHGNTSYVITLATREQHIRRAKATSNICTNEGLCALMTTIYMCLLGKQGLEKVSRLSHQASVALANELRAIPGVKLPYAQTPWFNEFVVELPVPAADVLEKLAARDIVGGVALSRFFPDMPNRLLVTCTEQNGRTQIARFVEALKQVLA